ncbi:MAG: polysaccharide deacetylase family protein [Tissierellales bacterium]|nr:polysaccharide deacetylase family protein [Tissierellales bacterium]
MAIKVVLITGLNNQFVARLITNIKTIDEIHFGDVIYWEQETTWLKKLKKNIKKHGLLYIPYRLIRFFNSIFIRRLKFLLEMAFYSPYVDENLYSACRNHGINLYKTKDIHSDEGIKLVHSLQCDIMAVCGTGILRSSVFNIPKKGTINLHQGQLPKYRGAPPGFWELWNGETQAGVTVHYIDEGVDTGDIIDQEIVPIFKYDDLNSLQKKLIEISLTIYPNAIKTIATESNRRIRQQKDSGKQYYFPDLRQRLQLWLKIWKYKFNIYRFLKNIVKKVVNPIFFFAMSCKNKLLIKKSIGILSVLYYHRVSDICQDGMTIGIDDFEKQIRFLKRQYNIISGDDLRQYMDIMNGRLIPKKMVLVTFDDGYEDNYTNALPILIKYTCPAIFFVSTGLIGNEKQFRHDNKLQPRLKFKKLGWEQLQQASQSNVEIGIHSHSHANLGAVPYDQSIQEIQTSLKEYQDHFGKKSVFMSYPFGSKKDITTEVVNYIRSSGMIDALFSAYGGKNIGELARYDIKRINIGSNDRGSIFWYKVEGGYQALFRR